MDLEQLRRILDLVREHDLSEFELEHDGLRVKIRKNGTGSHVLALPASAAVPIALPAASIAGGPATSGPTPTPTRDAANGGGEPEVELAVVKSPIVGTFYRSPEPGTAAFVEVGSTVKKGQVLCIIEAMKLMNEIDSEYDGEIANVYVENGQSVQYGERLFAIRTR